MGWNREEWLSAPEEMIAHFGLTETIRKGGELMQRDLNENLERRGRRSRAGKLFGSYKGQ